MNTPWSNILKFIIGIHKSIEDRESIRIFRFSVLKSLPKNVVLIKQAFDTRRINQDIDYNPRRNLQYYHRSDPFISKTSSEQIKILFKLKTAVDAVKEDFLGDPDWLDSYCRILCSALDRTLRVDQKDTDFFQPQIDYINELLYLRYRLKNEDIIKLNEKELRDIILDRDEKLLHKQIYGRYSNDKLIKQNQIIEKDNLVEKLLGSVKASKENKEVQRTVSIIVNDKIIDNITKES